MKKDTILTIAVIVLVASVAWGNFFGDKGSILGGGLTERDCTVSTVTAVTIGNQASTEVLSASGRRAWATLSQPVNATNNVSISLDEGADATLAGGIQLTSATSTSPITSIEFGLKTHTPYTGAVTAITDTSSTTIRVTQCNY